MTLFTRASEIPASDAMIVSAWGLPKSGKTTLVVGNERTGMSSFPLPIYYINFDQSLRELLPRVDAAVKRELYDVALVADSAQWTTATAAALLRKAEDALREAVAAVKVSGGTICVDTMSAFWQLAQTVDMNEIKAKRELKDQKLFPFDYAVANTRFRNTVLQLKASGANVVMLHHAREVYNHQGQPTGTYTPQDNNLTEGLVQTQIYLTVDGSQHNGTIQFCRDNDSLRGLTMPNLDYTMLYRLVYEREPGMVAV